MRQQEQVRHQVIPAEQTVKTRFVKNPNRVYIKVEKNSPAGDRIGYESPQEQFEDLGYRVEGGREVTGQAKVIMMSVEKEKYDAIKKAETDLAKEMAKPSRKRLNPDEFEESKEGGALTISQLNPLITQQR
jgi:hypothetical protein